MILFWFVLAIVFFVIEMFTLTFGFIFITFGAVLITFLIGVDLILPVDFMYQILIMLLFGAVSFIFFYRSFKKSVQSKNVGFKEDMRAVVVGSDLVRGVEGKIKWSGTVFNAILNDGSDINIINVGSVVNIVKFHGNIAIVDNNVKNN